jgi:cell division protein ZapA
VDIIINGHLYGVACDVGQETRVRELAELVDSRIRELTGPGAPVVGESHLLVLAGLMLADELAEVKGALETLEGQAVAPTADPDADADQELLIAAIDHLTERIGVIADRLDHA